MKHEVLKGKVKTKMQKHSKSSGFVNNLSFWKILILKMILKLKIIYTCTSLSFS